ncbi:ZN606 protein, partial [Ptilorrhoa leucosticta]|nr:ZN606 protein [Ptilorrhoa leucosticta]
CRESSRRSSWNSELVVREQFYAKRKPCKCLKCGKSFSWSSHLIHYQNTHTGEKS